MTGELKKIGDYYYFSDEGLDENFNFMVQLTPENYIKLLKLTRENGLITFDISVALNYLIEKYPEN